MQSSLVIATHVLVLSMFIVGAKIASAKFFQVTYFMQSHYETCKCNNFHDCFVTIHGGRSINYPIQYYSGYLRAMFTNKHNYIRQNSLKAHLSVKCLFFWFPSYISRAIKPRAPFKVKNRNVVLCY